MIKSLSLSSEVFQLEHVKTYFTALQSAQRRCIAMAWISLHGADLLQQLRCVAWRHDACVTSHGTSRDISLWRECLVARITSLACWTNRLCRQQPQQHRQRRGIENDRWTAAELNGASRQCYICMTSSRSSVRRCRGCSTTWFDKNKSCIASFHRSVSSKHPTSKLPSCFSGRRISLFICCQTVNVLKKKKINFTAMG